MIVVVIFATVYLNSRSRIHNKSTISQKNLFMIVKIKMFPTCMYCFKETFLQ